MINLNNVSSSHINAKVDLPATLGDKLVCLAVEVTGNKSKKIARLRERIHPNDKMAAIAQVTLCAKISVAQKYRE
jgi:hypothetical protein